MEAEKETSVVVPRQKAQTWIQRMLMKKSWIWLFLLPWTVRKYHYFMLFFSWMSIMITFIIEQKSGDMLFCFKIFCISEQFHDECKCSDVARRVDHRCCKYMSVCICTLQMEIVQFLLDWEAYSISQTSRTDRRLWRGEVNYCEWQANVIFLRNDVPV